MNLPDRISPQALDFERTVLGSGLIDPQCLDVVRRELDPTDFYAAPHRTVYHALCKYPGETVDLQILAEMLNDPGAAVLLAELCETIATAGNVKDYYIPKLKELTARRVAIDQKYREIDAAFNLEIPFSVPRLPEWTLENTRPEWILQEPEPFEFIIPGLLAKGLVGFIYGSGGTYKSLAALWLVLQRGTSKVIAGQKWLGRFEAPFGRSIFFSAEDVLLDLHHRINNCLPTMLHDRPDVPLSALQSEVLENCTFISREQWVEDGTLFLFDENGPTNKVEKTIDLINSTGADLGIFETCSRIFPLDENDNTAGARLVGVLEYIRDKTGATILVIDHSSKMNRSGKTDLQGQNSLRGAGAKLDNSRFGLLIEPQKRENGADVLKVTNSKTFRCKRAETFRVSVEYPRFFLLPDAAEKTDPNNALVEIVRSNPGIKRRDLIAKLSGQGSKRSAAIKWCVTEEFIRNDGEGYYVND